MADREELYQRAGFGKAVEAFWNSQIGDYLRNRAREEYAEALAKLMICDPTDSKTVMRLQGEVWRAKGFEDWLSEAIVDGIKSLDLIDTGETDDSE
jgi:hypothetical protein